MPIISLGKWLPTNLPFLQGISGVGSLRCDPDLQEAIEERIDIFPSQWVRTNSPVATPTRLEYYFEEKTAWVLQNVQVWPALGIAASDSGTLIQESTHCPNRMLKMLEIDPFKVRNYGYIDGFCTIIQGGAWWENYYHWVVDNLPRMFSLHHERFRNIPEITLLLSKSLSNHEGDALEALLPPNVRVQQVPAGVRVQADKLILPPFLSGDCAGYLPEECLDFLRRQLFRRFGIDAQTRRKERVFVSRQMASKRRLTNEGELLRRLRRLGFSGYRLEELSFPEQIDLFHRAEFVIAQHGAGLTNLLFASDCGVIEIFSSEPLNHYRLLAAGLNLRYGNVIGSQEDKDDDVKAPIEEVITKLKRMERRDPAMFAVDTDNVIDENPRHVNRQAEAAVREQALNMLREQQKFSYRARRLFQFGMRILRGGTRRIFSWIAKLILEAHSRDVPRST